MSHLFGYYNPSKSEVNLPESIGELNYKDSTKGIFVEGISRTSHYSYDSAKKKGLAVVGVLLDKASDSYELIDLEKGRNLVKRIDEAHLEGHYAIIIWDDEHIEIQLDKYGLRPIYVFKAEVTYFSTRLDWLCEIIPNPTLSTKHFGSFWLHINQITSGSFIERIAKYDFGANITFRDSRTHLTYNGKRTPPLYPNASGFEKLFKSLCNPKTSLQNSISLSGGIDSRAVISVKDDDIQSHSFGSKKNPDLILSEQIASKVHSTHKMYEPNLLTFKNSEAQIFDFVAQTCGTVLCSDSYKKEIMDGGFGELHRRQFLGRMAFLQYHSSTAIKDSLFTSLLDKKPPIFNKNVLSEMFVPQKDAIHEKFETAMMSVNYNLANAADLFSLHTRVKNITGYDQGWYDSSVISYMPFVHPEEHSI